MKILNNEQYDNYIIDIKNCEVIELNNSNEIIDIKNDKIIKFNNFIEIINDKINNGNNLYEFINKAEETQIKIEDKEEINIKNRKLLRKRKLKKNQVGFVVEMMH